MCIFLPMYICIIHANICMWACMCGFYNLLTICGFSTMQNVTSITPNNNEIWASFAILRICKIKSTTTITTICVQCNNLIWQRFVAVEKNYNKRKFICEISACTDTYTPRMCTYKVCIIVIVLFACTLQACVRFVMTSAILVEKRNRVLDWLSP